MSNKFGTDKFASVYNNPKKQAELSQYVHENFKVIHTKMLSEMRRKLGLTADMVNSDGYVSLMVTLEGRMFNEMVYSLCGVCQSFNLKASDIIPLTTLKMIVSLLKGENPLKGLPRDDVKNDIVGFQRYYSECIDELRALVKALPL